MFGIRVRLTTGLGRDRRTGSGPPNGVWLWGLGSMGQPNGVWRWGVGSMRAARHDHVGRALSGGGTARRVEGASNYFVDDVVQLEQRVDLRGAAGVDDASRL